MSIGQMPREIKRAENSHHPMRTMGKPRCVCDARRCALFIGLDGHGDLIRHCARFSSSFPERLAHIAGNGESDAFRFLAHGFCVFLRDVCAVGEGCQRPIRESFARLCGRGVDLSGGACGTFPDNVPCRGTNRGECSHHLVPIRALIALASIRPSAIRCRISAASPARSDRLSAMINSSDE